MFARAAELVGWITMTLSLLGTLGLIRFDLRIGLVEPVDPKAYLCTEGGNLRGHAYLCTETEWRRQGRP